MYPLHVLQNVDNVILIPGIESWLWIIGLLNNNCVIIQSANPIMLSDVNAKKILILVKCFNWDEINMWQMLT